MKEIIIDGVEYTLTPKVRKEEFTYPMWFKNNIGDICRFDKLNYATCVDSSFKSTWSVGEVSSNCIPHTNKDVWTQATDPKQTKRGVSMKALKIQEIICMDENRKFALVKSHTQEELIEAIVELEELHNRSCEGCVHHLSANGNYPLVCLDCSRFYVDKYKKENE